MLRLLYYFFQRSDLGTVNSSCCKLLIHVYRFSCLNGGNAHFSKPLIYVETLEMIMLHFYCCPCCAYTLVKFRNRNYWLGLGNYDVFLDYCFLLPPRLQTADDPASCQKYCFSFGTNEVPVKGNLFSFAKKHC